ncbi:HesA/MoeB/ThiF family protein [Conchiformibius kuhniae]|uniref:ThiF family adenylyltransferase n=1 Tax=Conchiformibius kuhniae TaxID=211502 RepID=A0A8T9MZ13_9NEIS|nr:HesA/MoeB/ThiF family protein [Conchiformibius kuhniae]UOP05043.1 HesA/MoeB/ThiF family protein [Conchiformibius kuhniae]
MNDNQLLRYSRHILLDEIGIGGQEKLLSATVLVVGCGGLGNAALPYLAAAGVGTLIVADDDITDQTNLQRQICFAEQDIGRGKAQALADFLRSRNGDCRVEARAERLDAASLAALLPRCDAVLDCCDNFATRHAINAAAVVANVPLVSGAAVGFAGQWAVFRPQQGCYACLFGVETAAEQACATFGVFSPLVGMVGTAQAAAVLNLLTGAPPSENLLHCCDARRGTWQTFRFARNPDCPVCSQASNY